MLETHCVAAVCLLATLNSAFAEAWTHPDQLQELDIAVLVKRLDAEARTLGEREVDVAEFALQRVEQERADTLYATACSILIRAYYRRGTIDQAATQVQSCVANPAAPANFGEFIRLSTELGNTQMAKGDPQLAAATYESLLARDLTSVPPPIVRQLRSNYAASLKSSGESLRPVAILAETLNDAIPNGRPIEQAFLGNNLIVMLVEQGLYSDAAAWMERLQPALSDLPENMVVLSLRLHEIQLRGLLGDPERAVGDLLAYTEQHADKPPLILGNAHEYLADFQHELGDYRTAEASARVAIQLLDDIAIERCDAELVLAKIQLSLGQLDAAATTLAGIPLHSADLQIHSRELYYGLQLRLAALRTGSEPLMEEFDAFMAATGNINRLRMGQQSDYFESQQQAERQAQQLKALEDREALSRAQSIADRQTRNFVVMSALAALILFALITYIWFQRRLRAEQDALTHALEKEVHAQSEALAKRAHTEALGQLTGNVAHDFNNLLQVIMIANERFNGETLSEASRRLLQGSNEALSSASGIVARLLAYARQQELDEKPVSPADYLRDTGPLLETALGARIRLVVDNRVPAAIGIRVDQAQLTSAIINLFKNAAFAIPATGTVQLSLDVHAHSAAEGSGRWRLDEGRYVQIEVSDNGKGMTPAEVERATEPFYSTRVASSGTGLGLSSVYGFVRQSGGDLVIESEPGNGTTVMLRFPAVTLAATEDVAARPRPIALRGKRALIVEDNEVLASSLNEMIGFIGMSSATVNSGDEAEALLGESADTFDIVISDIRMPGHYDGVRLADWVSTMFPELPVLLISGFNQDTAVDRPVLCKPFSQQDLRRALGGLLA